MKGRFVERQIPSSIEEAWHEFKRTCIPPLDQWPVESQKIIRNTWFNGATAAVRQTNAGDDRHTAMVARLNARKLKTLGFSETEILDLLDRHIDGDLQPRPGFTLDFEKDQE